VPIHAVPLHKLDKPSSSDTASPVRPDKIPIVAGAKAGRPVLPGDQVEEQRRIKK
jgi:hypothetical protein